MRWKNISAPPLYLNSATAISTSATGAAGGGGTVVLAGNAAGFSGVVIAGAGVVQFDSDARLGTGTTLALGNANLNQPAELRGPEAHRESGGQQDHQAERVVERVGGDAATEDRAARHRK